MLAIGLEVTMMLTLVGLSKGMLEDTANRTRGVGADILIRPPGSSVIGLSSAPMSEKLVPFVAGLPHVKLVTGTAVYPIGGVNTITGIDFAKLNEMSGGFHFLTGGPFEKPDELIVDQYYAQQKRLKAGDTMHVMNRDWRVAGIVVPGKLSRLFVQLNVLQDLTGNTGKLTVIYVKADDPANVPALMQALKDRLKDYQIFTMEEFTSQFSVGNLPELRAFIGVVIGLGVVVGFLVVFLSMYTAVLERTREVGILKALGASPIYVLNILFRETTLLAIAGSGAGILFTYGTRWLIMSLVPASLIQVIVPGWWPIAGGIAIGGALLGAMYPGWKAARQDAIEALAYE